MGEIIDFDDLKPGQEVIVTFEGTVQEYYGNNTVDIDGSTDTADNLFEWQLKKAYSIELVEPQWQPKDVVEIKFGNYTIIGLRDVCQWLTSNNTQKIFDSDVNEWYSEGRVTHLLRDGKPVITGQYKE